MATVLARLNRTATGEYAQLAAVTEDERACDLLVGNTQGTKKVGTQEMGDAIVKELDRLA